MTQCQETNDRCSNLLPTPGKIPPAGGVKVYAAELGTSGSSKFIQDCGIYSKKGAQHSLTPWLVQLDRGYGGWVPGTWFFTTNLRRCFFVFFCDV